MNRLAFAMPLSRVSSPKKNASDVDFSVSSRIRHRRIMLGLTQQKLAELTGMTNHLAYKYETAAIRVSAGRLYQFAQALGVEVNYFFSDADPDNAASTREQALLRQQGMLLDLERSFALIGDRKHQDALCCLTRALSRRD